MASKVEQVEELVHRNDPVTMEEEEGWIKMQTNSRDTERDLLPLELATIIRHGEPLKQKAQKTDRKQASTKRTLKHAPHQSLSLRTPCSVYKLNLHTFNMHRF